MELVTEMYDRVHAERDEWKITAELRGEAIEELTTERDEARRWARHYRHCFNREVDRIVELLGERHLNHVPVATDNGHVDYVLVPSGKDCPCPKCQQAQGGKDVSQGRRDNSK
jgi:hypothetical protein